MVRQFLQSSERRNGETLSWRVTPRFFSETGSQEMGEAEMEVKQHCEKIAWSFLRRGGKEIEVVNISSTSVCPQRSCTTRKSREGHNQTGLISSRNPDMQRKEGHGAVSR